MQGDSPRDGYELLAHLRRLETRMARLQKRWATFRADPRPERLEQFRTTFAGTEGVIRELAARLGMPADSPLDVTGRSDPHTVVESGRVLDGALGEAHRAWQLLRRQPDADGLAGLADRLARAEAAAGYLAASLPGRAPRESTATAGDSGERWSQPSVNMDALMDRIRADWQKLRRTPGADRARLLRGELAEARAMAERLGSRLRSGDVAGPDVARYLTGEREAVRFGPYRDPYTGLYTREGFDALAGAELKRCRRYGRSFGLLLIEVRPEDLDELRGLVGTLSGLLRGYDLVSRYGDDRVAVGLPETEAPDARRIAARLLRAMEGTEAQTIRRLSYALMPDDGASLSGILRHAEKRLAS